MTRRTCAHCGGRDAIRVGDEGLPACAWCLNQGTTSAPRLRHVPVSAMLDVIDRLGLASSTAVADALGLVGQGERLPVVKALYKLAQSGRLDADRSVRPVLYQRAACSDSKRCTVCDRSFTRGSDPWNFHKRLYCSQKCRRRRWQVVELRRAA